MRKQHAKISVVAELERIGLKFNWSGEDNVAVCCPFHDDANPSGSIQVSSGQFRCHTAGCPKSKADFIGFLAGALKCARAVIETELATRYDLSADHIIDATVVERYHQQLPLAGPLLRALYDRGITDATIRRWRLGEDAGRITIPIKNMAGLYVNVRRYLPGAPGKDKMRNTRGHGHIRLHPIEQIKYEKIVICGGEIKAYAAIQQVEPHGIGALTPTGGEGNWDAAFTAMFKNKHVWICLDIDDEGKTAAAQLANLLSRVAAWVGVVELPLSISEYPHGDLNDFVALGGNLLEVLEATPRYIPTVRDADADLAEEPTVVRLQEACSAASAGKRLEVSAVVTAIDQAPYVVPATIRVACTRDTNFCSICPVYHQNDQHTYRISAEGPEILAMVNATKAAQREVLMEGTGIPRRCTVCDFSTVDYYNVEDVRLSPRLDIASVASEREMLPAVCIGLGLELNENYVMRGRMHPHPKHQQSTLVISAYDTASDALSNYTCSGLDDLVIFQGTPAEKLSEIYADLEANVTRIFQRRHLHLLVDLAYHSPLFIRFDKRTVKGWVETLIVGDSSQGKTETATNLMKHYGLGVKVECKNASVAGLLGGLEQMSGKWFVKWGVIPTNDRRLVILEELKGASRNVISKLTDMRSSGIAEIPKIERRRTHARTRLVALSNPRSDMPVSAYNYGIEIIQELVGGLEDVRRFDAAMVIASNEIDSAQLNTLSASRPDVEHRYTDALCRELILWIWTRQPEQIEIVPEAEFAMLDGANQLCEIFSDTVPLVDRGSQRLKLARLATALAGRLYSTPDGQVLQVLPEHVTYIVQYLIELYSTPAFGYRAYSDALKAATTMRDVPHVKAALRDSPFPRDLIGQLLDTTEIEAQDIQDWCGWDRAMASRLISLLVRKRALLRDGKVYRKTPDFINFLRQESTAPSVYERPEYVPGVEF